MRPSKMEPAVAAVREQITQWRRTRAKKGAMPEELWAEAVAMALEYGTYGVSRALGLNYATLQLRMFQVERERADAVFEDESHEAVEFLELPTADEPPSVVPELATAEVELTGADGAKLCMRLSGVPAAQVMGLAEAFWRRAE